MTNTMNIDKQPVAPVEGHYAMLRNNSVCGPLEKSSIEGRFSCKVGYEVDEWLPTGEFYGRACGLDIIATISPKAMALAADSSFDRLIQKADEMATASKNLAEYANSLHELIPLADAVLDHADSHCRAFPIETAPRDEWFLAWDEIEGDWDEITRNGLIHPMRNYTHWRPLPPPPSNPPLPAVFLDLGAALERLKEATSR